MKDLFIEEIVALTLSPDPSDVSFIVDYVGLITLGHVNLLRSFASISRFNGCAACICVKIRCGLNTSAALNETDE